MADLIDPVGIVEGGPADDFDPEAEGFVLVNADDPPVVGPQVVPPQHRPGVGLRAVADPPLVGSVAERQARLRTW